MKLRASSAEARFGAKPPSSPTLVLWPAAFSADFSEWKISAPMRSDSAKLSAPAGTIMNSWMSIGLSAWTPPLMMFISGTGSTRADTPPTYLYSGRFELWAAALATARLTPRMALAPRRLLFGEPSNSIMAASRRRWSSASKPVRAS